MMTRENLRRIKKDLLVYDKIPAKQDILDLISMAENSLDSQQYDNYHDGPIGICWDE